jgi:hypothetical protein
MSSTLPPPREHLCNRSCSNKTHTHTYSGVLGSIPKREEPGKTGAPCVKVPGSSRVPAPPWVARSLDGWDQILCQLGGWILHQSPKVLGGRLCERRRGSRRGVREGACIGVATMTQTWTLRLTLNAAALSVASPTLLFRLL